MKKYVSNIISYNAYKYLITVLDYETSIRSILQGMKFDDELSNSKILVDLALKVGLGKYRFVEYDILKDGTVDYMHGHYTEEANIQSIKDKINTHLINEKDIFDNSPLLPSQKRELMNL